MNTVVREKELLLGKKNGKGFYIHDGAQKHVNPQLALHIKKQSSSHKLSEAEIELTCMVITGVMRLVALNPDNTFRT